MQRACGEKLKLGIRALFNATTCHSFLSEVSQNIPHTTLVNDASPMSTHLFLLLRAQPPAPHCSHLRLPPLQV